MDEKYSPKGERKRDNFYLSLGRKRKKESCNKAPQPRLRLRLSDFIQRNSKALSPKEIKLLFKSVIDEVCVVDCFEPCENSTSSLTIKMVDKAQSKVRVGYDVVILQETDEGLKILRCQNKGTKKESFVLELLPDMTNMSAKLAKIKGKKQCDELRERYYNKKTNYNGEKKSFQLLNEAINEVLQLK